MSREPNDDEILLPPHGRPPALENRAQCRWCGDLTLVATLNHYGVRCFSCYEAYRAEPQKAPPLADKRTGGPKAWAYALKAREESGERLTPAQRDTWRAALRSSSSIEQEAS